LEFPKSVRNQILIASARHCCICHRYKGVKVEVHHIKPEGSGGGNVYENAIALCFDCHADAGHYNPNHPRGTRISQEELIKARDSWFGIVASNNIPQPQDPDLLYCRYYLCKNYEQLVEIANGDLSRFPVNNPLLVKNQVINSLKKIIRIHSKSDRHARANGKYLSNKDEYIKLYPNAIVPDRTDGNFSYFEVIRTPSKDELDKLSTEDGLLKIMLETNLPIQEIAMVGCYNNRCAGIDWFQEEYIFRNLWCSFLAITNMSNQLIQLNFLRGNLLTGFEFQSIAPSNAETHEITLPKASIHPNATVLVPIAIILPPFHPDNSENWSQTYDAEKHVQVVSHEGITSISSKDYLIYKSQVTVKSIVYKIDGQNLEQSLHDFDLGNMYTIDRCWECGSCPHLFYKDDIFSYSGEILALCNSKMGVDCFKVPDNKTALIIAEIEDEVTEIVSLSINGENKLQNIFLNKNQFIEIEVIPGSQIEVIGRYMPNIIVKQRLVNGIKRNELVGQFLKTTNQGLINAYTQKIYIQTNDNSIS
jgi:hypothetical protein